MDHEFSGFLEHGYRIDRELGHNRAGGRVTYLATAVQTDSPVVIKQFQFARSGSSWSDFDSHQREVQLLKTLKHPGIPRYLDSFQLGDGFCLVQEYKNALPLSTVRSFSSEEVRQVAIAILDILIYLQNLLPPVIHRDLKPENILMDDAGHVYLVDFGFAHVGEGEIGVSSVVKGTLGFMPPEQLFRRQLTEASDLYGLGMTLICLLTRTKSDQIGDLVDISYRVSFKHLVPRLNARWVGWLEKMAEPRLGDRFPNALAAMEAVPKSPLRPPEAHFSASSLTFQVRPTDLLQTTSSRQGKPSRKHQLRSKSRQLRQRPHPAQPLTQSVTITNPVAETLLEGQWELMPHPHDPTAEREQWITIEPAVLTGNQTTCHITVDPRKLMAGKTYHRTLQLHTNTLNQTYDLNLQIQTAAPQARTMEVPYPVLILMSLFLVLLGGSGGSVVAAINTTTVAAGAADFGAIAGLVLGLEGSSWVMRSAGWKSGALASTLVAGSLALGVVGYTLFGNSLGGAMLLAGVPVGAISGIIAAFSLGFVTEELVNQGKSAEGAIALTLLTAIFSASLGLLLVVGVGHLLLTLLIGGSGLAMVVAIVRHQLQRATDLFSQRKSARHLIKP